MGKKALIPGEVIRNGGESFAPWVGLRAKRHSRGLQQEFLHPIFEE